ncbi:MAG: GNAT family N-acetyltransferase [Candidatus Hodarchaeales archaeon]|jgi:GNAT superfamily N-acetyltransferase
MIQIEKAHSGENLIHVRKVMLEYVNSLDFDLLDFQDFEKEFARLPGEYGPPEGCLLLAMYDNQAAGCVALRKIDENVCEMKRLHVLPIFQRKGIGKALSETIIQEAREIGYKRMLLDTVPSMKSALKLYYSLGFKEIDPYRYNPIDGAKFLELIISE